MVSTFVLCWVRRPALLLTQGAEVDARKTWDRTTPLYWAAGGGHFEVVQLLLARDANVNATLVNERNTGQTALHEATLYGHTSVVQALLDEGADTSAIAGEGLTALTLALYFGFSDIVALMQGDFSDPLFGQWAPYRVVISDPLAVRGFLYWNGIEHDEIWIPGGEERLAFESALSSYLQENSDWQTDTIRSSLRRYNREYSGYTLGGSRFVISNMLFFGGIQGGAFIPGGEASEITIVFDGGCGVVLVLFDVEKGIVITLQCNGYA